MLQTMAMRATEPKRIRCRPSQKGRHSHYAAGFTLLELVMGLGFIMVMSAIIAPNLQASLYAFRLNSALSGLEGKLAEAHFKAQSQNTDYEVKPDTSNTYELDVLTSGSPRTFGLAAGEEAVQLPTGVSFGYGAVSTAAGDTNEQPSLAQATAIAFNSMGLPVNASDQVTAANAFYLTCNGQVGAITVTEAGKIQSWLWNGSAWIAL